MLDLCSCETCKLIPVRGDERHLDLEVAPRDRRQSLHLRLRERPARERRRVALASGEAVLERAEADRRLHAERVERGVLEGGEGGRRPDGAGRAGVEDERGDGGGGDVGRPRSQEVAGTNKDVGRALCLNPEADLGVGREVGPRSVGVELRPRFAVVAVPHAEDVGCPLQPEPHRAAEGVLLRRVRDCGTGGGVIVGRVKVELSAYVAASEQSDLDPVASRGRGLAIQPCAQYRQPVSRQVF